MGDPARRSAGGEDHREHLHRNADGLENDARVEVHVGIEALVDEITVLKRDLLQALRHPQRWIVLHPKFVEHFMAGLLHDLGARVVALVHAMAEAHQAEGVITVLGFGDELVDVLLVADFVEHVQHRLVGAAVGGPPEGGDAGGDAGVGIGAGGASHAHGGRGGVLLMVGMKQQNAVHGPGDDGADFVVLAGGGEHHVQEVLCVA